MLSDSQIDRYSRQIVLSEIGGRGQERLLRAEVAIQGCGDAALVCATYLAGAGVGTLSLSGIKPRDGLGNALDLVTRNPDCLLVREPRQPSVTILLGGDVPDGFPSASPVVWGATSGHCVRTVHFPAGHACASCLRELAGGQSADEASPQILGTVLAVEALRALLELSPNDCASLVEIDVSRATYRSLPFPARTDCARCHCGPSPRRT
jgi:hypothetical protein